jgi:hypothetical protein
VARHGGPLLVEDGVHVGARERPHLTDGGLGQAGHGAVQVEDLVGLGVDEAARLVELVPHHEHHEGQQHRVDRAEGLQVIADDVVRRFQGLHRQHAPRDAQASDGQQHASQHGEGEGPQDPDQAALRLHGGDDIR